jgi:uncharacterized protein
MIKHLRKYTLMALGVIAIGLAVLGIVIPILPATPWAIVAAYCFAKSEPKWEKRLLEHARFGPVIIAWRDRQAIPRPAKWAALIMIAVIAIVSSVRLPLEWAWIPSIIVAILAGIWIWTRPDR